MFPWYTMFCAHISTRYYIYIYRNYSMMSLHSFQQKTHHIPTLVADRIIPSRRDGDTRQLFIRIIHRVILE